MKVDPIHFFNERGLSLLSEAHMHKEIADLREENETLQRTVNSLALRLRMIAGEDDDLAILQS